MSVLSRRKERAEFGGVAEVGEGGLVLGPGGPCDGVFGFFFCATERLQSAFAVVVQGASDGYLAQGPNGVGICVRCQLKINAGVRKVLGGIQTFLARFHKADENAGQGALIDAEPRGFFSRLAVSRRPEIRVSMAPRASE